MLPPDEYRPDDAASRSAWKRAAELERMRRHLNAGLLIAGLLCLTAIVLIMSLP